MNKLFLSFCISFGALFAFQADAKPVQAKEKYEYEVVPFRGIKVVLFKSSLIRELVVTSADSQMTESDKIKLVKAKFFIDSVSIGDGKSYCDAVAQVYSNEKSNSGSKTAESISKNCNELITDEDFIDQIIKDPIEIYDLNQLNLVMSMSFKLMITM